MTSTKTKRLVNKSLSETFADNRVPEIVISYWAIKIAATTLGETGADMLSMTFNLGYATTAMMFFGSFILLFTLKQFMKRYNPSVYWLVFTATSLAGTAMSDFMDRTLGFGYATGSMVLIGALLAILGIWRIVEKSISVEKIVTPRAESFYWLAFLIANTLGTALGDYLADTSGIGFAGSAILLSGVLIVTALLYYYTRISRILLFWIAFVLTRPFGATFGDFLTKPLASGGLNLGTIGSSVFFVAILLVLVLREHKKSDSIRVEEGELEISR
ncbi:MAG TPA: hypothetical protein PLF13_00035 [candidate division Zixibacteria bacterium]|nr:hypothetical protein [candidate division Zixibacteria bacterium]